MSEELILRCEDSLEGMFTAVYDAFVYKNRMQGPYTDSIRIEIGEGDSLSLFAREIAVRTDADKVRKTVQTIQRRLGYSVYDRLLCSLCHFADDRATAVLGYLVRGFAKGPRVSEHMADPYVMRIVELSRKVYNEREKFYGFLRFQLVSSEQTLPAGLGDDRQQDEDPGVLWAEIEPKCNLVPIMTEHFADRFPGEHFIIYDPTRKLAAVHEAYHACVLVLGQELLAGRGEGDFIEALWKRYYATTEIRERHNERCQRTLMPFWYRKHMTECEGDARI